MPGSISSPENTDEADVSLFDRQSLRLGGAGRMVARASYDALVLRGTTGQLLGLPVDDAVALGRGVGARCPLPEHDPRARRLVALDRNCLRRLAESAVGQPVHGLLDVLHRGVVRLDRKSTRLNSSHDQIS